MTLSILFLCFSGRQGSILTITRRWQCRSILQRFIEHTGKLNFHLFSGNLLGYLDLPPSPSSLVEGNTESLFSRSRPLKFAINNNNMGWWCINCFSCIGWKPAASHTLLVVLAPFEVGKRDGFSPLQQVQIFTQQIYSLGKRPGLFTMFLLLGKLYFIHPHYWNSQSILFCFLFPHNQIWCRVRSITEGSTFG